MRCGLGSGVVGAEVGDVKVSGLGSESGVR